MADEARTSNTSVEASDRETTSTFWGALGKVGKWALIAFAVLQLLAVTVFDPEQISVWLFGLDLNPPKAAEVDRGRVDERVAAVMREIQPDDVERHFNGIVSHESRAVGYSGEASAWNYLQDQFSQLGLNDVRVDTFQTVVPIDKGGAIHFADGSEAPLYSVWPNQVRTPTLPRAKVSVSGTEVGPLDAVFPDQESTWDVAIGGEEIPFVHIPRKDLALSAAEQALLGVVRGEPGVWNIIDYSEWDVAGKLVLLDMVGSVPTRENPSDSVNVDVANVIGAREAGARGVAFYGYSEKTMLNPEMKLPENLAADMLFFSIPQGTEGGITGTGVATLTPGIDGELVYVGPGEYGDFNGRNVDGSIIVMSFQSGTNYLNARILGAKAIVFIDDGGMTRTEAEEKFLRVPADVPRYYADGDAAMKLRELGSVPGNEVTLTARMEWSAVTSHNIFGIMPGTRTNDPDSMVVLQAYYDATSVVPARAIGAENAVGIVSLLSIAESFHAHPPEVPFMFLATGGHFSSLSGIQEWLYRHVRQEKAFASQIPEEDQIKFGLFIGLDLSSQNSQVATFAQGTYYSGWVTDARRTNMHTGYGKAFMRYARELFPGQEINESFPQYVDAIAPAKRTWRTFTPSMLAFDHEPVNYVGLSAISFATTNDARMKVDTPADTLGGVNIDNVVTQAQTMAGLLYRAARDKGFFQETKIKPKDTQRELTGRILQFDRRKSFVPNSPIPGAIVTVSYPQKSYSGVRGMNVTLTNGFGDDGRDRIRDTITDVTGTFQNPDEPGRFRFHMIAPHINIVEVRAYKQSDNGRLIMAPDLGEEGDKTYPMKVNVTSSVIQTLQVLFESRALTLFEIIDSRYLNALDVLSVRGPDGSELRSYGMDFVPLQSRLEGAIENAAVVFAKPGTRVKVMMSTSLFGIKYLLIKAPDRLFNDPITPEEAGPAVQSLAEGRGYLVDDGVIARTPWRVARDMWIIDDVRMKTLQRFGVVNQRVFNLHNDARTSLLAADEAYADKQYDTWITECRQAWGLEARAYPDVKGTAVDTVQGVVFYFALLLPFAFFMERLLIGAVDVRRQILGFSAIFVGIFLILQLVHPAFKLSSSPYIIFLGFVIFALGAIVTVIIVGKFNNELKRMKMSQSGMHETDVGRIQATAAAVKLGINNLRKRPTRTGLTAITIAILTFSVLSFTSVVTELTFYKINRDNEPGYDGMLIRDRNWMGLQPTVIEYVRSAFRDKALITPRSWLMAQVRADKAFIDFVNEDNQERSFASGLLGVTSDETRVMHMGGALTAGRWLLPGERGAVILSDRMASLVNIDRNQVGKVTIDMLGRSWTVVGLFDEQKVMNMTDLDDEMLTPVDLVAEQQRLTDASTEDPTQTAEAPIQSFTHIAPENIIIMPYQDVMVLGGTLRSVAVSNFNNPEQMITQIEDFMSRVALTAFVGHNDKVEVYSSLGSTSLKGLSNLGVPIVVAALIVLNTMLGAVYDRKREIGIFATIGLTPSHIAALFIAEASVYAVIGAVWGYLIGQVLAIALANTGLLSGMSLNYSSLSAVSSTAIVMITVLLSSLYPAKVAANSAVPDVTRRWAFPPADGDFWRFDFPFTVGQSDVIGLYTYLARVLEAYGAGSAGEFVAQNVGLEQLDRDEGEDPAYRLTFRTWLAPYDLGISQDVQMDALPTGEYRIYRIDMTIHRLSGDVDSWQRINRGFMNVMRKRFLVWRTVTPDIKDEYRERGRRIFGGEEVLEQDTESEDTTA